MPPDHDEALLSVAQAASLVGVHPNTIRTWTDLGRLAAYRINARGDRRYRRGDVARLLVEDGARGTADGTGPHAAFARLGEGLAVSPTIRSVARGAVDGLRLDAGLSRAAIYAMDGDELTLVAHGGYLRRPPLARGPAPADGREGADLVLPLTTSRTALGALVVDAVEAAALPEGFLASFARTTAAMIAAAERLSRSRREFRRMRALRSVTKELTGTLELSRVLEDVIERTRTLFGADRAGIWLLHEADRPVALATRGLSDAFLARSATLTPDSWTISLAAHPEGGALWARDADRDPAVGSMRDAYAAEGIRTACIVPLLSRGVSIGVICLYHDADRTWPDEEVDLVRAFADQAAVAIQNARLYRSVADQAARMRSIQDLSARLNRLTDVQAIADAIVSEARTLADYHDIRVYRVNRQRGVCEPIAFTREMLGGEPAEAADLLRVRVGEGLTGWVAEHGQPLLINDALEDARDMTIAGTDDAPKSMLIVPMLYEGRALGVIVLSELGYDRFSADDLQTMSIFAGYAAQAMANADTYETLVSKSAELEVRAESQRRLLEINERLLTTLEPAGVFETIADGLRDVVAYDNLSVYRADHARGAMIPVVTRERHAEQVSRYIVPFGRGLMGWAVQHGRAILANDALHDPRALQIPGTPPDPEAVVVVPLLAEGAAIGCLNVSRVGGPEIAFSESEFEIIQLFAAQASIALRNADAHHATERRADTDALTGLGNHGAFQRELARAIDGREADPPQRLALIMMDLDDFKAYNDQRGHPAGDALLHRVATAVYGAIRSDDRVYRYGGDEFALILVGATATHAVRIADRVRRAVAELTAGDRDPVTMTLGVAALPGDAHDRPKLIAAADTALFYGKRAGGDRVVRVDELPEDVHELRDTLEQLATAALRDGDDAHVVEHIAEHATALSASRQEHRTGTGTVEAERVVRVASALCDALGMDDDERGDVELAARLVDLDDRSLARLSTIGGLGGAAALIAGQRTLLVDGTRRGRRVRRARGVRGAHVVAVAALYDAMVTGGVGPGRDAALEVIRDHPATFRSDVLTALAGLVRQRPEAGARRRRRDPVRAGRARRGARAARQHAEGRRARGAT